MKIHHFVLTSLFLFMMIAGALSAGFYNLERNAVLEYITNGIQQSVFRVEEDVKANLQAKGQAHHLQSILDRASAIDVAIKEISLSVDGKTIGYSSQRSQTHKPISSHYGAISQIAQGLSSGQNGHYQSEFEYFDGESSRRVLVFIDVDKEYVYGQLDRLAWMFGAGFFLLMIGISFLAFVGVRRLVLYPLKNIALKAKMKDQEIDRYFIQEFSSLSQTIAITFRNMWLQNEKLEESLEESRYLTGILRTVTDVNQLLISSQNVDDLIQQCCERISKHEGYGVCWIGLFEDQTMKIAGCVEDPSGLLYRGIKIHLLQPEEVFSCAPSVQAYHEDTSVILNHLEKSDSLSTWSFIAREGQYGSFIALPFKARSDEKPFGVLCLYAHRSEGFLPEEILMLEELAGDIGFALHAYTQREQLTRHLGIDSVSGLPNRTLLIDYLSLNHASALAILNIDRFSDINDVYGVAIGDQVLSGYGYWLRNKVEKTAGILLYKLGSDEYALVFEEHFDADDALAFLEYLVDKTEEESFVIDGIEVVLSITVGFDPKSEKLIENATRALKQAKLEREKISIYTPLIGAKKEHANNIEWYKEIREALEEDRIVPYFQPIVDNKTHEIIKYEALIRLIKRDGAVVSPFHFLDIAKKIRLYPALTKRMIEKVAEQFETCVIPVSINLSTDDLLNRELADYIEELLLRTKIGGRIIFEVLESEGISNYTEVSTFIERFKAIGCAFAIDDFGSGYSNFDHLLRLNIDTLKIDGSLIKNLPHDRNAQIIVSHICNFAHEMGFSTIAEFVADEAIYHKVLELGIDASQGYYFYEPLQKPIIT